MNLQSSSDLDRAGTVASDSPCDEARAGRGLRRHTSMRFRLPRPAWHGRKRLLRRAAPMLALALLPAVSASGDGQQIARSLSQLALLRSALITQGSPRADVSVTVTAPNAVGVNTQLSYRIAVTNLGPDLAVNVRVTDHLPPSLSYVSANTSQGRSSISAGIVRSEIGSLLVGQTVVINLIVIPRATGNVVNGVAIQHDSLDPNHLNNSDGQLVAVLPLPPPPPPPVQDASSQCAADVTASLGLARGPLFYAPLTRRFLQQIIIENRSRQPIQGPVSLLVHDLAPIVLTNASGFTGCWPPIDTPFLNVPVGTDGVLKPGEVTSVTVVMAIPPNEGVTYRTRVVAGPGGR